MGDRRPDSLRRTQWVVAPNAELAQHRAMVDGRVSNRKQHIFDFDDLDKARKAAALNGERVYKFTYSVLPVDERQNQS